MRVLLVSPEFPPYSLGGGGVAVKNLSEELCKKGVAVTVLSGYYLVTSVFNRSFSKIDNKVRVEYLPLLPTLRTGFQLNTIMPPNLFSVARLFQVFAKGEFDIVHLHGYGHFICDFASFLCKFARKKYLLTIHGFPKEPERRGRILKFLYSLYTLTIGTHIMKRAAQVVAVSKSVAEECHRFGPGVGVKVIHNAVDLRKYSKIPLERTLELALFHNFLGKRLMLCIGRLAVAKGFQNAIRAARLVNEKIPSAHLVIIGKDDGYGYLKDLRRIVIEEGVESSVSFVGGVSDNEKRSLLWMSDVVVIPSLEEPFGIVALEAMASGRSIVASRVGGLVEILSDDKYTLFVDSKNVSQLADGIIKIMNNRAKTEEAQKERFQRISQFDLKAITEKYIGLYQETALKS